jgi:hypothetical protein
MHDTSARLVERVHDTVAKGAFLKRIAPLTRERQSSTDRDMSVVWQGPPSRLELTAQFGAITMDQVHPHWDCPRCGARVGDPNLYIIGTVLVHAPPTTTIMQQ